MKKARIIIFNAVPILLMIGLMPLWLPFLWGYGFVAIKRAIEILNVN